MILKKKEKSKSEKKDTALFKDEVALNYHIEILKYHFEKGVNFKARTINLVGEICDQTFNLIDMALTELESLSRKRIVLKLNSNGGCPNQATAILSRIRESKCTVDVKGYGQVASAATIILAGTKGRRSISKYSEFLWHSGGYELDGTHEQNKAYVDQFEIECKRWAKYMGMFTLIDAKKWYKWSGEEKYLTANDLLQLGVVDEIF